MSGIGYNEPGGRESAASVRTTSQFAPQPLLETRVEDGRAAAETHGHRNRRPEKVKTGHKKSSMHIVPKGSATAITGTSPKHLGTTSTSDQQQLDLSGFGYDDSATTFQTGAAGSVFDIVPVQQLEVDIYEGRVVAVTIRNKNSRHVKDPACSSTKGEC